jgi:hypothetical protein
MTRALFGLLGFVGVAAGQVGPPAPPRFGIAADPEAYPQATPQAALTSTVRALERGRIDYVVAHLLDPAAAEPAVLARAQALELGVEEEFRAVRDQQRRTTRAGAKLPADPAGAAAAIRNESLNRGFRVFVRDVAGNLAENPDHLRDLQRVVRDGTFTETGDAAKATVPEWKDRQVFFKRTPAGWVVLDRRQGPAAPN